MSENRVGPLSVAREGDSPPQPVSPTGKPMLTPQAALVATILVAVAGGVLALPTLGVAVPPLALGIANLVIIVGVALGIASPGIRSKP